MLSELSRIFRESLIFTVSVVAKPCLRSPAIIRFDL